MDKIVKREEKFLTLFSTLFKTEFIGCSEVSDKTFSEICCKNKVYGCAGPWLPEKQRLTYLEYNMGKGTSG